MPVPFQPTIGTPNVGSLAMSGAPHVPKDLQFSLLVIGMALELADEAARTDIEANCRDCVLFQALGKWWDTSPAGLIDDPFLTANVTRSLMYLELRQLVVRHAEHPHLVRFVEPA